MRLGSSSVAGDESWARPYQRWRIAVPALTCLAALLLMTLPVVTPGPSVPHLVMLSVLIWSSFQPALMPPYLALPVGILTDAVLGLPIGINATLMPGLTIVVGTVERRFGGRPYLLDWLIGAVLIFVYQYIVHKFGGFVSGRQPFQPFLAQAVTTTLAYPVMVAVIVRIQRRWGLVS